MNTIPRLTEYRIFSSPNHGYASFITDPNQLVKVHCHSYYEIFIVAQGSGTHFINSKNEPLSPGDLYFIRPDDIHCYINTTANFKIINMIIPQDTFELLCSYLEGSFGQDLLSPAMPPRAALSMKEFKAMITEFEQLVLTKKILKEKSDIYFRITVFNLLTRYFLPALWNSTTQTPQWLRWLSLEMLKKENFTEGLPALYRLSGKSVEHLSRSCRKYLHKSPSRLINDIRLEYAADRILHTDAKIISICEDAGFETLSHFYHVFKEAYGMSPAQFRKQLQSEQSSADVPVRMDYDPGIPDGLPFDLGLKPAEPSE